MSADGGRHEYASRFAVTYSGMPDQPGEAEAFVTGMRIALGEAEARSWLEGIRANRPTELPNNTSVVSRSEFFDAAMAMIEFGWV